MSSPTPPERVPSLDDILARLAELAPPGDAGTPARRPQPEVPPLGEDAVIDLDALAETAPAPVAVAAGTESTAIVTPRVGAGSASGPEIDLRDRTPAVEPDARDQPEAPDRPEPAAQPETHEQPEPAAQPETHERPEPAAQPEVIAAALPTAIDRGGDRFDLRPSEPPATPATAAKPTPRPPRSHNPFRRLIIWSVVIGLMLIVVAGLPLVS